MTKIKDKDFWRKEFKMLWKLFDKLQKEVLDQHKLPLALLKDFEEACNPTLHYFLMGKSHPDLFTIEEMKDLESEASALGYDPNKGVCAWFKNRKKEKMREFHETRTRPLSGTRDKIKGEIACVKIFYKNKGQCLKDNQIKLGKDDEGVDVIVEEHGKKTLFQVTHLQREAVRVLFKGWSYFGKGKTVEEIKANIEKVIMDKKPKGRADIILLLDSLLPLPDVKLLDRAVAKLSTKSCFKGIYIVTPKHNIPVKRHLE